MTPADQRRFTPEALAYRAKQRRRDRSKLASLRTIESRKAKETLEQKQRNRAIAYLSKLPTSRLMAVYKAAVTKFTEA